MKTEDSVYSPEHIKNIAIACHYALKDKTEKGKIPFIKSWQELSEEDKLLAKEAVVNILNNKPIPLNEEDTRFLTSIVNIITGSYSENYVQEMMDFGRAIEALKQGKKVSRKGWNGSGMFLYLVPGSTFQVNRPPLLGIYEEGTEINYRPHIDLKTADGSVATWSPSGSDTLAEDWEIVN